MDPILAMADTGCADYLRHVAERTATILRPALVGTYLHGSAVLGGFAPARSDLDLLVVATGPLDAPTTGALVVPAPSTRWPRRSPRPPPTAAWRPSRGGVRQPVG